ncbi:MAG: YhbY family RNA-binding protein [Candidatus Thermoplasmatota archaeon]|nr:YhbY family RNA-binding protein [Candidatus Thermoplasmatota archaeon]
MDKKTIKNIKGRAQPLEPSIHIGKEGITENIVAEVSKQLKKHKIVKVRLLQNMEMDRREAGVRLAEAADAVMIEVRGRTVVLAKK